MNEDVKKKRLNRKSKKLIIVLFFTMAFFVVITYAWFIGLSVAKVNTFEIKISANEGLSLSLDGLNFYDEINLGNTENEILETVLNAYPGNPNSWLGVNQTKWNAPGSDETTLENKKTTDLLPVSTNGLIDQNGSVLTLFSKSSMTSTEGGYSLTSDRYLNKLDASGTYIPDEQKGYIAFNLFIKNNDNTKYIKNYNMFNDEAIYMSTDSSVKLVQSSEYDGESSGGDGLENSLRIAFMQIGRVDASSSQEDVTSITCATTDTVTGLCNVYSKVTDTEQPDGTHYQKDTDVYESNFNTFAIWEPNDLMHTEASKTHFTRICRNRVANTTYSSTPCTFNENGYIDTYVVRNKIVIENGVDIYDGLNSYSVNTNNKPTALLQQMRYYTDSVKKDGDYRNQLFMLAPNSITLVKVYIYLEGQDIDNYDIDSIGKSFSINFGFTKDKYEDTEGGNSHIAGDFNGDGIVNDDDELALKDYLSSYDYDNIPEQTFDFIDANDINNDGIVDGMDTVKLKRYLNGTDDTFPLKEFHETFPDVNFRRCLFENYVEGESLICPNMNIKSVQGIETLGSIEEIDLSNNRIEKLDIHTITVKTIDLSHNKISDLSGLNYINGSAIGYGIAEYSKIDLSYNNLTSVDMSKLNTDIVILAYNNISSVSGYGSYLLCDLSHNNLSDLNVLDNISGIEGNLSYNNITLHDFSLNIVYPNILNLSHNNLSGSITYTGGSYIDLSYNGLTSAYFDLSYGYYNNLSHNKLESVYIYATYADEIDLSYNNLTEITDLILPPTTSLNLSYNNISVIDTLYTAHGSIDIRNNRHSGCVDVSKHIDTTLYTDSGITYCS